MDTNDTNSDKPEPRTLEEGRDHIMVKAGMSMIVLWAPTKINPHLDQIIAEVRDCAQYVRIDPADNTQFRIGVIEILTTLTDAMLLKSPNKQSGTVEAVPAQAPNVRQQATSTTEPPQAKKEKFLDRLAGAIGS